MPVPTGYAGQPAYSMPPPQPHYPPGPQYPPHSVPPHMQHQQPPQQQQHPPGAPPQHQQYGHPAAYQSQPYGAGPPQPQLPAAAAQSTPEPQHRSNPGEVQQLKDMFPAFDNAIIEGVLIGTQGDVEQAIESLLSMS